MNIIHEKYIELFGSSPHNRTVRIDKDKLTIIGIDNEIIDEFKNWKEMKKWLENTQEVIFNKRNKMQTLQDIKNEKLVMALKTEYVHKKYYCSIKRFYNWKIFKRWYYHKQRVKKYWKEYYDIENI